MVSPQQHVGSNDLLSLRPPMSTPCCLLPTCRAFVSSFITIATGIGVFVGQVRRH